MDIASLQRHAQASQIPLESIQNNTTLSDKEKIAEASRQFESLLVKQFLTEAQKTTFASDARMGGAAGSIYKDMVVTQMADSISKSGGFGLARAIEPQLMNQTAGRTKHSVSTEATTARQLMP
jgi:Rod binding domain-containing protein